MIWIDPFVTVLRREYGDRPAIAMLATVTPAGRPAGRCLVLRDTSADGTLCFTSDTRSEKIDDLRHTPFAETVFWLEKQRRQFRIAGPIRLETSGSQMLKVWSHLSAATQQTFLGGPPGQPVSPTPAVATIDPTQPPTNFAILLLSAEKVESLDLTATPHERVRWSRQTHWRAKYVNP